MVIEIAWLLSLARAIRADWPFSGLFWKKGFLK
jgi:hypothetical protein